jgi:hypothetical protein
MCFTKIQQDIIKLVLESQEDPNCTRELCMGNLQAKFKYKYTPNEIEGNVLKLISKGVFEPYCFQSQLRFTERFKYLNDYRHFVNNLSYSHKI